MLGDVTGQLELVQVSEYLISILEKYSKKLYNTDIFLKASVPLTQKYIVKNGVLATVERFDTAKIIISESRYCKWRKTQFVFEFIFFHIVIEQITDVKY